MLRRAARVRRAMVEALERLPAASLQDVSHAYPVTGWLPEFAWEHEEAHIARIRDWWAAERRKDADSR